MRPAISPVNTSTVTPNATVVTSVALNPKTMLSINRLRPHALKVPTATPKATIRSASPSTSRKTVIARAPSATRTPISRVRLVTQYQRQPVESNRRERQRERAEHESHPRQQPLEHEAAFQLIGERADSRQSTAEPRLHFSANGRRHFGRRARRVDDKHRRSRPLLVRRIHRGRRFAQCFIRGVFDHADHLHLTPRTEHRHALAERRAGHVSPDERFVDDGDVWALPDRPRARSRGRR